MNNRLQELFEQNLDAQIKQAQEDRKRYWIKIPSMIFDNDALTLDDGTQISIMKYMGFQGFYLYCVLLTESINRFSITTTKGMLLDKYATKGFKDKRDFHTALCKLSELNLITINKSMDDVKHNTAFECRIYNPPAQFERVKVVLIDRFIDGTYDYRALSLYALLYRYHNIFNASAFQISNGEFGYAFPSMDLMSLTLGCSKSTIYSLTEQLEITHGTKHKRILSVHREKQLVETDNGLQRMSNKYCCYPKADPQNYYHVL